jgi:hypothetical protein
MPDRNTGFQATGAFCGLDGRNNKNQNAAQPRAGVYICRQRISGE